jgi:hypothetical protein
MVSLRGVVPLVLTGSSGLALLAFGVGGLSGVEPQLERAARTVEHRRATPPVLPDRTAPDVPSPDRSAPKADPDVVLQDVDCPQEHDKGHRRGEV